MTTTAELAEQRRAMLSFEGRLHEEVDAERDVETTLPVLIDRERRRRDADLRSAAATLRSRIGPGDVGGRMESDAAGRYSAKLSNAAAHDTRLRRFEEIAAEKRASVQVREPEVYGPGTGHSFYLDHLHAALGPSDPRCDAATGRLQRHSVGVSRDVRTGNPAGQRALRQAATMGRAEGGPLAPETRAMSSGTAGAFVTPMFLTDQAALWQSYRPAFYDQTTKIEDPGYGLAMSIPAFGSGAAVSQQVSETAGISNATPTAGYLTANLATAAGEVDMSQQLVDRAGPEGFDQVIHAQLMTQLWTDIDAYVLAQAMATGGTVTSTTAMTVSALWGDVANAGAAMLNAPGQVLDPTICS